MEILKSEMISDPLKVFCQSVFGKDIGFAVAQKGGQANTYILHNNTNNTKIVLKHFRSDKKETYLLVENEYNTLLSLSRIQSNQKVSSPKPIMMIPNAIGHGYLMEYIEGYKANGNGFDDSEDLARIIDYLLLFYEKMKIPYGDFHSGNIIFGENRSIYLIDPGAPSKNHRLIELSLSERMPESISHNDKMLSIDVGYFVFSEIILFFRSCSRNPRRAIGSLLSSNRIITVSATRANCFVGEFVKYIGSASNAHCKYLIKNDNRIRGRLIGIIGLLMSIAVIRTTFVLLWVNKK